MAQTKQFLIIAASKDICIKLKIAFDIKQQSVTFFCGNDPARKHKICGKRFDTVIVHESFISFLNPEQFIREIQYHTHVDSKIFHVEENEYNGK